jgi:dihydroorotate dehydrogenase (NAD+) catalytic subunit
MPLIGSGGILSPEDAFDYLSVGANAIALGTGLYLDPKLPKKIIEFLKNTFYLKK